MWTKMQEKNPLWLRCFQIFISVLLLDFISSWERTFFLRIEDNLNVLLFCSLRMWTGVWTLYSFKDKGNTQRKAAYRSCFSQLLCMCFVLFLFLLWHSTHLVASGGCEQPTQSWTNSLSLDTKPVAGHCCSVLTKWCKKFLLWWPTIPMFLASSTMKTFWPAWWQSANLNMW